MHNSTLCIYGAPLEPSTGARETAGASVSAFQGDPVASVDPVLCPHWFRMSLEGSQDPHPCGPYLHPTSTWCCLPPT